MKYRVRDVFRHILAYVSVYVFRGSSKRACSHHISIKMQLVSNLHQSHFSIHFSIPVEFPNVSGKGDIATI